MKIIRKPVEGARGRRKQGRAIVGGRATFEPPDLRPGQVRCHVCRNAAVLNPSGKYRKHQDLLGLPCYAIRPHGADLDVIDELPPVLHRGEPVTPGLDKDVRPHRKAPTGGPPGMGNGVRAWGVCEEDDCEEDDCDVIVSGERRFCGIHLARRMAARRG